MKKLEYNFEDSLFENIFNILLIASAVSVITSLSSFPLLSAIEFIVGLFNKDAFAYVTDKYEPFRISVFSGFLGSIFTFAYLTVNEWHKSRQRGGEAT